jgi:hypothetical protein
MEVVAHLCTALLFVAFLHIFPELSAGLTGPYTAMDGYTGEESFGNAKRLEEMLRYYKKEIITQ